MKYLAFPWEQIGILLRRLSLSGEAGDVAAWILYAVIGAAPVVLWGWLIWKRRNGRAELLLPLLSVMVFVGLWFLTNPSYLEQNLFPAGLGEMGKYVFALTIDSILLTWLLLRFLKGVGRAENKRLLRKLEYLLGIYVVLTVPALVFSRGEEFLAAWEMLREGNSAAGTGWMSQLPHSMQGRSLLLSYVVLVLQFVCKYIPSVLELVLWVVIIGFLRSCEEGEFTDKVSEYVQKLKKLSTCFLSVILCTNVSVNLLQLILAPYIYSSQYVLTFPLSQIIVVLGILMLSRFYLESKRLKEDNELFI